LTYKRYQEAMKMLGKTSFDYVTAANVAANHIRDRYGVTKRTATAAVEAAVSTDLYMGRSFAVAVTDGTEGVRMTHTLHIADREPGDTEATARAYFGL
jgi:hypothetical protein